MKCTQLVSLFILIVVSLLLVSGVVAQENTPITEPTTPLEPDTNTTDTNAENTSNQEPTSSTTNSSEDNTTPSTPSIPSNPETPIINEQPRPLKEEVTLVRLTPTAVKYNQQVQLNILVENTGEKVLENLMAIVTGEGFSTSSVIPIDNLAPGQKSYILVTGKFESDGDIPLEILIHNKRYTNTMTVIGAPKPNVSTTVSNEPVINKTSLEKEIRSYQEKYLQLEKEFVQKRQDNYDVQFVSLDELKEYIRDAQKDYAEGDFKAAVISLTLAKHEYESQVLVLSESRKIKKSFLEVLSKNAVAISAIIGATIASFSLFEILRKKNEGLAEKLKTKFKKTPDSPSKSAKGSKDKKGKDSSASVSVDSSGGSTDEENPKSSSKKKDKKKDDKDDDKDDQKESKSKKEDKESTESIESQKDADAKKKAGSEDSSE